MLGRAGRVPTKLLKFRSIEIKQAISISHLWNCPTFLHLLVACLHQPHAVSPSAADEGGRWGPIMILRAATPGSCLAEVISPCCCIPACPRVLRWDSPNLHGRVSPTFVFLAPALQVSPVQAGLLWELEAPSGPSPSPSAATAPAGVMRSNAADSAAAFYSWLRPSCRVEN